MNQNPNLYTTTERHVTLIGHMLAILDLSIFTLTPKFQVISRETSNLSMIRAGIEHKPAFEQSHSFYLDNCLTKVCTFKIYRIFHSIYWKLLCDFDLILTVNSSQALTSLYKVKALAVQVQIVCFTKNKLKLHYYQLKDSWLLFVKWQICSCIFIKRTNYQ